MTEPGEILELNRMTELSEAALQQTIESLRHIVKPKAEVDQHATFAFQRIAQLVPLTIRTWKPVPDLKHRAAVRLTAAREIAVRDRDSTVPPDSR